MERKKALAVSVVAALMVLVMVVMAAALVQMSSQSRDFAEAPALTPTATAGTSAPTEPVIEYQDVFDLAGGRPAAPSGPESGEPAADPSTALASSEPSAPTAPAATSAAPGPVGTTPTTAAAPGPATTSTLPPGVPADWPAGKPIPPMPPGCQKPQLEDNGVWNCDH